MEKLQPLSQRHAPGENPNPVATCLRTMAACASGDHKGCDAVFMFLRPMAFAELRELLVCDCGCHDPLRTEKRLCRS